MLLLVKKFYRNKKKREREIEEIDREERYRENRVRLGIIILNVKTFIINL